MKKPFKWGLILLCMLFRTELVWRKYSSGLKSLFFHNFNIQIFVLFRYEDNFIYNKELASFFVFPWEPAMNLRLSSPRNQQEVSFYHIREYGYSLSRIIGRTSVL
jgi:hypothetical protein